MPDRDERTTTAAPTLEPLHAPQPAIGAAKIMIVDDDPTTVDIVQSQLAVMGYSNLVVCADSAKALCLVESERPDVLLLDIFMPEVDGFEILRSIRASAEHGLMPVIIMTARNDCQTRIRALDLGATDFLAKPIDFVELAPRIRNALVVKACHDELKRRAEDLRRQVEAQTASLKESHAALERANAVLRRSCEAADAATRAKSEFLANVSHELRTPLTAIIGFSEELLAEQDGPHSAPRRAEMLDTVLRNARHLLEVVNDILDLARVEKGQLPIERSHCSPAGLLDEVARLMGPQAKAKGLEFCVETPTPAPETICTDPTRLRQILVNLVGNAVKFTEKGQIRLVMRSSDPDGPGLLRFEVIDTGIGIDPAHHREVFEPFVQVRASHADRCGGTGLGLTICRHLAEELGGTLDLESRPGKGSTFRVCVPVGCAHGGGPGPAEAPKTTGATTRPAPGGSTAGGPLDCRVLVAEDCPDTQRLVRLILERHGARVAAVDDGQAAFETAVDAWRRGTPFDLVLTDIQMPVLDGYALTARLRAAGYPGQIVALTANAMRGEREKCLAAGCDGYLSKPIDRSDLLAAVARSTGRHPSPHDAAGADGAATPRPLGAGA